MKALQSLENSLNDIFVKKMPAMPQGAKKAIDTWLPQISLVLGVLVLLMAYTLYHWAHAADSFINYANGLTSLYGGTVLATNHLSFTVWLALALAIVSGLLYIVAYPGVRDHKKSGWDLMFYALLAVVVYAIVNIFTNYGGSYVIIDLIGAAIGLYVLFQLRSNYVK